MGFKEVLKKDFFESENKIILRYKAAKIILVISILLFFISFFFVGAGYYREFFSNYLSITYVLFVTSIEIYLYFYFRKSFVSRLNAFLIMLLLIILGISFVIFLSPVIVEGGFMGLFTK
ncbi:MAG: hypothetical protein PHV23_02870 [Candidatus Gracilibacteria bacterium]|nr:hypothetical protein [Candidatus Gracilibacteria bacterium]